VSSESPPVDPATTGLTGSPMDAILGGNYTNVI